jgi:hypothetical protein
MCLRRRGATLPPAAARPPAPARHARPAQAQKRGRKTRRLAPRRLLSPQGATPPTRHPYRASPLSVYRNARARGAFQPFGRAKPKEAYHGATLDTPAAQRGWRFQGQPPARPNVSCAADWRGAAWRRRAHGSRPARSWHGQHPQRCASRPPARPATSPMHS